MRPVADFATELKRKNMGSPKRPWAVPEHETSKDRYKSTANDGRKRLCTLYRILPENISH